MALPPGFHYTRLMGAGDMGPAPGISLADRAAGISPAARARLSALLMLLLLLLPLIRPFVILTAGSAGLAGTPMSDFDIFHLSARAILAGDAVQLYDESWFRAFQREQLGQDVRATWTYPPPFDLVMAPFGLISRGWALLWFMLGSLAAYLLVLRRLAGPWLPVVLILLSPLLMIAVFFGQNGLLTGALIGLACAGLLERRRWAGVPLGLMIIKPHLAIGFAVHVIARRDWRSVGLAALVVALASGLATLVLGTAIWPAFLAAAAFAGDKLSTGYFPFYRMISAYAGVSAAGGGEALAAVMQFASAVAAVALVVLAGRRLPAREALGVTAIAGLMISPYAFDYDLSIAGVGLALLAPALARHGRPVELVAAYALFLAAAVYGTAMVPHAASGGLPSLAAIAIWGMLALIVRILWRGRAESAPA